MKSIHRRQFLGSLAAGVAAAGVFRPAELFAKANELPELASKATSEGELTYYASTNPVLSKKLVELFNKRYPGIKVNVVRLASGPLGRRYASEAEAGDPVADILQLGDALLLEEGYAKGWFADLASLPAYATWPQQYKTAYSAVVSIFPQTITYNTNLVKGENIPTGWESMLDSKWKGRILMADIRNSPNLLEWAMLMQDTYGADFLKQLGNQRPRIVPSTLPGTQMVAAGESAFVLPNLRMVSFSLIEKGAPLDDITPTPTCGLISALAISKKARHPNAARLFSNFILTREAQEVLSAGVACSPLPDVKGALPIPKDYRVMNTKLAIERGPEMLALLGLN